MVLLYGRRMNHAFKVGNYNSPGWIAYALGNILIVKRFAAEPEGTYPDLGCNVEAYVKDACLELEILGTLVTLKPGESIALEETWEIINGEFPATLNGARKVRKQLSLA
jgi:hypothetical protein